MNRADSLQQRIDALKRKCQTGYGCGSTCISLQKECRSRPGSAIGKERLNRLMALAAGAPSSQRGIGRLKAKEAGELAGAISLRRGEKAAQLRGARQQAAAEKAQAAQAAEAAALAAAQARQPRPSAGDRPMAPAGTPRGEADRAAKVADPDYEFARPSAVGNVGEDLKGSARHKANQWRTLEAAEADGTAAAMVTRDKLLKAEPLDLTEGLTQANYLTRLAGHLALKSFPAQPYTDKAFAAYERGQITGKKTPAEMRKLYYDHLQEVKGIIDRRRDDANPRDMLAEISQATLNRIAAIRGDRSQPNADRYNPLANSLVELTNKVSRGGYSNTSITGQINTLGYRLKKSNEGSSIEELAEVMRNATAEILGGASIDKVTGRQRGGATINAADLYVKKAVRTGGRSLNVDDTPAGSTTVLSQRMGMRGLQFGNSVTDDERAHHLRKTAEAMVDLADVTGLPDRAISLNGTLGLAFGARGKGRASAHYEPGSKVINITRKNGVGTLAHEWGHALDNYLAEKSPRVKGFMSEAQSPKAWGRDGLVDMSNDPVWKAMDGVRKAIFAIGFDTQVRQGLRDAGIKPGSGQWNYWTQDIEVFARCFERHVQHKLRSKGQENTYLSGIGGDSKLWPTAEQAKQLAPAFDELMQAVRTNTFGGMKNRTDSREQRIQRLIDEAKANPYSESTTTRSAMPLPGIAAIQQRIDAGSRNCSTGYPCGASCIAMGKICRKNPGGANQQKMQRILALAKPGAEATSPETEAAAVRPPAGASTVNAEKGGAIVRQTQAQEQKRKSGSTADEKYAGKADDASVTAYAKEKVKELLDDPKQWENSEFVKKYTKDDYFGHATMVGDDAKALRAFNSFMKGQLKTRQAELDRGYSFATDRPEDIEKQLEKAKVSKAKNKAQKINYLTHKLADAKQQLEDARVFVEETYPRMNAMSNDEKVAYARDRARKRVETVVGRGMRDLKSAARGGKEVAAVADFLRVEQGGQSKGVSQLLGEDVANDKDVIRAQLTGKGTAEGVLGLRPGQKPSREALKSAYRKAAAKTHPDAGGSPEEFRMTQQAYERLKKKYRYDSLQHRLDALRARCTPLNG